MFQLVLKTKKSNVRLAHRYDFQTDVIKLHETLTLINYSKKNLIIIIKNQEYFFCFNY